MVKRPWALARETTVVTEHEWKLNTGIAHGNGLCCVLVESGYRMMQMGQWMSMEEVLNY